MKVKVKSFNGELPEYLIEDKEYEIEFIMLDSVFITTDFDDHEYVCITLNNCKHLNGGDWEIINNKFERV